MAQPVTGSIATRVDDQLPPTEASLKHTVLVAQTLDDPVMGEGKGFTVKMAVV